MSTEFITYFGYGSLVNRATRPAAELARPARLYGWRRVWGHRVQASADASTGARQSCCSLSVEPLPSDTNSHKSDVPYIDGVIVTIPLDALPDLDQRESGYDRVQLSASEFDLPDGCSEQFIHVYQSDSSHAGRSDSQHPILQSYIDCVLAGYCAVFEQHGMQHFVDSTVGWGGVIENDRDDPKYPRAVQLPQSQLDTMDELVNHRRLLPRA